MYTVTIRNMTHLNSETACADLIRNLTASQIQPTACHTAHERLPKQMSELFGYPAINGSHNPEFLIRIYITKQLCYCTDMIKCMKSLKSLSCLRLGLKLQNPCFGSCFFHQSRSLLSDLWSKTRSHFTKNQYFFNPSKNLVRP